MVPQHARPRWRWWSLGAALVFFALAITILVVLPALSINRAHVTRDLAPAHATLPATAVPATSSSTPPDTSTPSTSPSQ